MYYYNLFYSYIQFNDQNILLKEEPLLKINKNIDLINQ